MDIVVTMDDVTIFGVRIRRPDRIPRSRWILYWESSGGNIS